MQKDAALTALIILMAFPQFKSVASSLHRVEEIRHSGYFSVSSAISPRWLRISSQPPWHLRRFWFRFNFHRTQRLIEARCDFALLYFLRHLALVAVNVSANIHSSRNLIFLRSYRFLPTLDQAFGAVLEITHSLL